MFVDLNEYLADGFCAIDVLLKEGVEYDIADP